MAVGLGGEQLWLSPTVANNVNPFDDLSSQGNNGTAQGGLSTITDSNAGGAYAYDFDGVNDRIDCPAGCVASTDPLTVSLWVYSDPASGSRGYVADWNNGQAKRSFLVGSGASITQCRVSPDGGNVTPQINSGSVAVAWTHITFTHDPTTGDMSLYKNGVFEASGSQVGRFNSGSPWTIGSIGGSGSYAWYFDGKMDDIRAYKRVITQAEITHLATSRGVLGPPGGATHYNPFKSHAFINDFQQRLR